MLSGMVDQSLLAHLGRAGRSHPAPRAPEPAPRRGWRWDRWREAARTAPRGIRASLSANEGYHAPPPRLAAPMCRRMSRRGRHPAKLKSTYDDFEQKARWGESAAVAQLLVPERRSQFLAARARDGKDLNITDIELLNVVTKDDGTQPRSSRAGAGSSCPRRRSRSPRRPRCGWPAAGSGSWRRCRAGPIRTSRPAEPRAWRAPARVSMEARRSCAPPQAAPKKSAHRPGAGRDGGRRASPHGTPSHAQTSEQQGCHEGR
jgi:hypothetical protein